MKLLIASVDFPPMIGGVANMTKNLALALAKQGHDVTVMSPHAQESVSSEFSYIEDEAFDARAKEGPTWVATGRNRLIDQLTQIQSRAGFDQMLACHFHYYGQGMTAMSPALRPNCSVLFHGFEVRSLLMPRYQWNRAKQAMRRQLPTIRSEAARTIQTADQVFTNSQFTMSIVRRLATPKASEVIGCGVQLNDVQHQGFLNSQDERTARQEARRALGLPEGVTYIGFVGRMVSSKNVDTLLHVLRQLPEHVHAILVGDGPQLGRLKELAHRLGIAHRIVWTGRVSEETKWLALRAMDVFLLLSKNGRDGQVEGFGIVCLEAGVAGTPVIASNHGGIPDAVIDGVTGILVDPENREAIVRAIDNLLSNPDRAASLVKRARNAIGDRHTWHHVATRILKAWKAEGSLAIPAAPAP